MKNYQQELDKWFKEKDWQYWTPHEIIVRLFEEGGELARLINHIYGPKKKKDDEAKQDLEEEIGDIIYTLICLANSNDIDLDKAIRKSFDKVTTRDKDRY
ncbi:MAG TPA: MazG nucleotide pyrophosphohydrolase domain-containing protein [Candidatus Paceibacterota bacterium]|nr:MazG nucleotide pyrophosphohydrolase domain-containing protein [Candidatus Paceibacterota bacterium]